MRVLLDTCVWGGARSALEEAGHEVEWVGDWAADPGDQALIEHAFRQRRIIVTLDKDFGELAIVHRHRHSGIIRLVGIAARLQGLHAADALSRFGKLLEEGGIVTVEPGRVRVRASE